RPHLQWCRCCRRSFRARSRQEEGQPWQPRSPRGDREGQRFFSAAPNRTKRTTRDFGSQRAKRLGQGAPPLSTVEIVQAVKAAAAERTERRELRVRPLTGLLTWAAVPWLIVLAGAGLRLERFVNNRSLWLDEAL